MKHAGVVDQQLAQKEEVECCPPAFTAATSCWQLLVYVTNPMPKHLYPLPCVTPIFIVAAAPCPSGIIKKCIIMGHTLLLCAAKLCCSRGPLAVLLHATAQHVVLQYVD